MTTLQAKKSTKANAVTQISTSTLQADVLHFTRIEGVPTLVGIATVRVAGCVFEAVHIYDTPETGIYIDTNPLHSPDEIDVEMDGPVKTAILEAVKYVEGLKGPTITLTHVLSRELLKENGISNEVIGMYPREIVCAIHVQVGSVSEYVCVWQDNGEMRYLLRGDMMVSVDFSIAHVDGAVCSMLKDVLGLPLKQPQKLAQRTLGVFSITAPFEMTS